MIFENYAFYPHLTAFENIAMPLRARRLPLPEIKRRVIKIARMLRIELLMGRHPASSPAARSSASASVGPLSASLPCS
jgi:inositol-phosphate transport system ATP-binding protein